MLVAVADHLDEDTLLHEEDVHRDLRSIVDGRLLGDILDEAVLSRLDDGAAARSFLRSRVVDHRDIGIRVLVEAQQLVEVDVVDEAAACQQDVFL